MNKAFVNLLLRCLILAVGIGLSTVIVPGIRYDTGMTLFWMALVLTFFNAVLKPLLLLFTLPFIILTLGIGIWIINAVLFLVAGRLVTGFHVDGFGSALWGALIVSLTNMVMNRLLKDKQPPKSPPPAGPAGSGRGEVIDI